jgi:transcriptional regulator with XRE-family HTH domain
LVIAISPEQCRAARGLVGWSQQDLATRAQVARKTIADFELGQVTPYARTMRDVVAAFAVAGVEFLSSEENGPGQGVRFTWGVFDAARKNTGAEAEPPAS